MPIIYLHEKSDKYGSDDSKISVKETNYEHCNLFIRFNHKLEYRTRAEDIYLSNLITSPKGSVVIHCEWTKNEDYILSSADVYFNRYEKTTPVMTTLHFSNKIKLYHKFSTFASDMKNFKDISQLFKYTNDEDLLMPLIDESNYITNFLTFNLTQANSTYCNNRIRVTEIPSSIPKIERQSFKRYQHTPQSGYAGKKSCVMIGTNELMNKLDNKSFTSINDIQNQIITAIKVYLSTRFNTPLLAEISKNNNDANPDYYCVYKDENGLFYCEKLDHRAFEKYTGVKASGTMSTEMSKNGNRPLLRVLKRLESCLYQTMIVMIDQKGDYGKNEVVSSFADFAKCRPINSTHSKISVKNSDYTYCLGNTQFKVFEHDLNDVQQEGDVNIKLLIRNKEALKHSEITLYRGKNTDPEHIDTLEYQTSQNWENKVYVYFYGQDPRPLFVIYNDNGYRPKNKKSYFTEWIRVEGVGECHHSGYDEKLINNLSEVIKFLNKVNIYRDSQYEVHTYNNHKVSIQVNSDQYSYCYKKYEHTPERGYTLGSLHYDGQGKKGSLSYINTTLGDYDPLNSVSVYYLSKDSERGYPLLVELKFGSNTTEHYRLSSVSNSELVWVKDNNKDLTSKIKSSNDHTAWYLNQIVETLTESRHTQIRHLKCDHDHSQSNDPKTRSDTSHMQRSDDSSSHHSRTDSVSHRGSPQEQHHGRFDRAADPRFTLAHQQNDRLYGPYPRHILKEPQETGVQKATRIASSVGTFALAGTGIGIAIHKYSQWFIALFRRLF